MGKLLIFCCAIYLVTPGAYSWGSSDKVKLRDIDVLTLRQGQWTTGRRSSPVPQIKCVGGTAGCGAFVPQVVQCYNRGWDGNDVQWECKADMDNDYRFGDIAITCEGYDYADDPYILKGSCGLEYNMDLTKEGYAQRSHSGHSQSQYSQSQDYSSYIKPKKRNDLFSLESLTLIVAVAIVVYAIYKTCIAPRDMDYTQQRSNTSNDYPGGPDSRQGGFGARPPPYGFNIPSNSDSSSCGGGSASNPPGNSSSGFWTGAATGGLLGYMFGSSGRNRNDHGYFTTPRSSSRYDSWGTPSTSYSSSQPGPSTSSGTRTASGFGGTRRR